ncbi:PKD domain-containing protein [Hymenobacter sp. ASUV-10]|uniref:PKD domain-containing protein n=1 Tax=Hymenobacter aranciens TaxID=3063996 RepID=A0ABT9BDK4_9BACT|nr:PKD domain-containing protein [Hymenobacter sp. ASUV-10]
MRWNQYYPCDGSSPGTLLRQPDGYLLLTNVYERIGTSNVPHGQLTKVNLQQQVVWQRDYHSQGYRGAGQFTDIIAHPDGSYLVGGLCDRSPVYNGGSSYLRLDYWLLKLRPNGDTIATTHCGDPARYERVTALRLLPGDALALAGVQADGNQKENPQLLRLDNALRPQPQWTRDESNPNIEDNPHAFLLPLQSGAIVTGGQQYNTSFNPRTWAHLLCLNPTGTVQWEVLRQYPNRIYNGYSTCLVPADGAAYLSGGALDGSTGSGPLNATGLLSKYAGVGLAYQPDLCRTPPTASFAPAFNAAGDSVLVLDQSTAGPTYGELVAWHWDFGDGSSYDGPTPPWHRYATPPGPALRLTLTVTNNLGCQHTTTLLPLASRAQQLQARLSLYPNPATEAVTVALDGLRPQPALPLEVVNALSQVVLRTTAAPRQGKLSHILDLQSLSPGVYLVRLHTADGIVCKRFVVR